MFASQLKYPIDTWPPIIDNEIVTDTPLNIIKNGNFSHSKYKR